MLEEYLEPKIRRKLKIAHILFTYQTAKISELAKLVGRGQAAVREAVTELSAELRGKMRVTMHQSDVTIALESSFDRSQIITAIASKSLVLKCLVFLLTNPHQPFIQFTDKYYLSSATAYRIKRQCVDYLNQVGLKLVKQRVAGDEFRIRFLIALLSYRYGMDCAQFDQASMRRAYGLISAASPNLTRAFLQQNPETYDYYAKLVALTWLRHDKGSERIYSHELETKKKFFDYDKFCGVAERALQPSLPFPLTQGDFDYLYLVTCVTGLNGFESGYLKVDQRRRRAVMLPTVKMQALTKLFAAAFGRKFVEDEQFQDAILEFNRKFLLNLQGLVYDRTLVQTSVLSYHQHVMRVVEQIIKRWQEQCRIYLPVDHNHVEYLVCRIEVLLATLITPANVVVFTNVADTYNMIKSYLDAHFTTTEMRINPFLLSQPLDQLKGLLTPDTLVVATPNYHRYLQNFVADKNIIDIEVSFPEINIIRLRQRVNELWEQKLIALAVAAES